MNNIVTNLAGNSHLDRLKTLSPQSEGMILVSPFLYRDMGDLLSELDMSKLVSFRLITTLKPKSMDQLRKADSLFSLLGFFETQLPLVN